MSERQIPFDQFPESLQSGGLFKKAARLRGAAFSLRSHFGEGGSAKAGEAKGGPYPVRYVAPPRAARTKLVDVPSTSLRTGFTILLGGRGEGEGGKFLVGFKKPSRLWGSVLQCRTVVRRYPHFGIADTDSVESGVSVPEREIHSDGRMRAPS